jgi:hypothetical protein
MLLGTATGSGGLVVGCLLLYHRIITIFFFFWARILCSVVCRQVTLWMMPGEIAVR